MKILWLCRWFGDYRIPVYKKLYELTDGNFYMVYSKDMVSNNVHIKMQKELGSNAIALENEKHFIIGNKSTDFANSHIDIPYQPGLATAINKINPDIIISDGFFQWTFIAFLKSRKRKLCVFYERTAFVERNCSKWRYKYRQFIGKYVDGFLINGKETREYLDLMKLGHIPNIEGCMVADSENLANDVGRYTLKEKIELKSKLAIQNEGLTFLFIGQLVERKGIRELLEAWIEHINVFSSDSLIIIGDGILRAELEENYSFPSIKILGQIMYDQIYRYYSIANVFIMPTLEDNWSLVVPEAMACTLPIATTPYNGCHIELVKEGENGYVFDPKDQNSILNCLKKFHFSDLEQMGLKSKELVKEYTPSKAADRILRLCKEII